MRCLIASLLLLALGCAPAAAWMARLAGRQLAMTGGEAGWLIDRSDAVYSGQILRLSKENTIKALNRGERLIEIEFPTTRGNDPSVSETLDRSRTFAREFLKDSYFTKLGKELWVLMPDAKEANLARQKWGENLPFVLTSIEGALTENAQAASPPRVIVSVSPGFNIDEWINTEKVHDKFSGAAVVTINGNLERLRNGYYPSLFYPGLTQSTNRFYRKFKQALFLNPIAVGGDRLGAWLFKGGDEPWQVLVKTRAVGPETPARLDCISSSSEEPKAQEAWRLASSSYKQRNPGAGIF